MTVINRRLVLASRPSGEPTPDNFRLEAQPLPPLADGQVLVRHHFLSLDPYMRGRMNEGKSYAQPQGRRVGSLFPTSIGANPQLSIYGIVAKLADALAASLGRPAPVA